MTMNETLYERDLGMCLKTDLFSIFVLKENRNVPWHYLTETKRPGLEGSLNSV